MKRAWFKHEMVASIPEILQANTLYITEEGDVAGHLCACGCGREVITPLSPTDWSIEVNRSGASLSPSIGNWAFPCRSHYFICDDIVVWARDMPDKAVAAGRERDQARKRRYYEHLAHEQEVPSLPETPASLMAAPTVPLSIWRCIGTAIICWWRRLIAG